MWRGREPVPLALAGHIARKQTLILSCLLGAPGHQFLRDTNTRSIPWWVCGHFWSGCSDALRLNGPTW